MEPITDVYELLVNAAGPVGYLTANPNPAAVVQYCYNEAEPITFAPGDFPWN